MKKERNNLLKSQVNFSIRETSPYITRPQPEKFKQKLKHIQEQAKKQIPSNYYCAQVKEKLKKPQVEIIYLDRKKMFTRLKKMHHRIQVGKYRMLIDVQNNPENKLLVKEKKIQDEMEKKEYKEIYQEFIEDHNTGALLKLSNQVISLYEMYDEADAEMRIRNPLYEPSGRRQTKSFTTVKPPKSFNDSNIDFDTLPAQNLRKYYDKMYEKTAAKSSFSNMRRAPDPEKIIKNRFQEKFFWDRTKRKQEQIPRNNTVSSKTRSSSKKQIPRNPSGMNNNVVETEGPSSCLKILNQQNRLLDFANNHGISEQNRVKLVKKFDQTIFGLKKSSHLTNRRRKSHFVQLEEEEIDF